MVGFKDFVSSLLSYRVSNQLDVEEGLPKLIRFLYITFFSEERPRRLEEKPIFDPSAFGFGTIVFQVCFFLFKKRAQSY
jgi:hypothetical protein